MSEQASPAITRSLIDICRDVNFDELPADAVFVAKQCFLDWLGVTIAGSREPLARILRELALDEGGNRQATLVGTGDRVTSAQAALVNGATSHALDYDDVLTDMSGHPSVPVIPALLALGEELGASGSDAIAALVAAFEMEARVGALVMPGHYAVGFHATGTVGTFGATAACAHLLRLDEGRWGHALGIAGAQAAGLKSMFGTMTKPLQAGKAAANGLLAARLAARGFTANPEVLETPQGFAATQTMTPNADRALAGRGESLAIRNTLFKYHAACYGTHETIEAVTRLKHAHGIAPGDVTAIDLEVPPGNLQMCNIQQPRTALEGKFSLRFTAALALITGDTTESAFTDSAVRDPSLIAVRDRVSVAAAGPESPRGTTATLHLASGESVSEHVDLTVPAADLDRQWQLLTAKFLSLAAPVVGDDRATSLVDSISRLEELRDIGQLARAAVREPRAVGV